MKKDKTEIIMIVDNSGSMASIKNDMHGGIKVFLDDQKKLEQECNLTYYKFSSVTEKVFERLPIKSISEIKIEPKGSTALFDAIGTAINDVGNRLSKESEKDRPELVVFVIVTDGEENSSKEFNNEQIKSMIKHQESKYNWQFIYLGANQDAFSNGILMGVSGGKSMTYSTDRKSILGTYSGVSYLVGDMRMAKDKALVSTYCFSDEDRKNAQV